MNIKSSLNKVLTYDICWHVPVVCASCHAHPTSSHGWQESSYNTFSVGRLMRVSVKILPINY